MTQDEDEELISLNLKSLYTNVPVDEAITVAAEKLYSTSSYSNKKNFELMKFAVKNVKFEVGDTRLEQVGGLTMDST